MDKLTKIEMAAKDLINYYCPKYSFVWDSSKVRKGECRYGLRQIGLSKPLAEVNTFESMCLTIIHEIAHALTRGDYHGPAWKALCLAMGGDGQRTYSSANTVQPEKKWIGQCPQCLRTCRQFRRTKTACGVCCKGIFNEAYLMQWTPVTKDLQEKP